MGLVFDRKIARMYDSWYNSPQGRAIDKSIEHLTLTLLDPKPGERVLDIGCGSGNHIITLNRLGLDVSGVDASAYMLRKAEERIGRHCYFRKGKAEALPFEDNEFDSAVLINSLEFLDNPVEALREAGRVANRKVFVGVINSLSWNGMVNRLQGFIGNPLFNRARFYHFWQMKKLLKQAYGPAPVRWEGVGMRALRVSEMRFSPKKNRTGSQSPFGFFLAFSITMVYRIKTDNLPLSVNAVSVQE